MKNRVVLLLLMLLLTALVAGSGPAAVQAQGPIDWEVINPAGAVRVTPVESAPRITTLEGKTVLLRWNSKPNGDKFLDSVAKLLAEKVKGIKVIKLYEVAPETGRYPATQADIDKAVSFKPDLVIASQAD